MSCQNELLQHLAAYLPSSTFTYPKVKYVWLRLLVPTRLQIRKSCCEAEKLCLEKLQSAEFTMCWNHSACNIPERSLTV